MASSGPINVPFGRPNLGAEERLAVSAVLDSPQLVHGPKAMEFEEAFSGFLHPEAHATSVSSCTAGLLLAYMHLKVGPGDEVIVPALTHVATAHAVEATGARPVFVDSDVSGNIDVDGVEAAITERTRAICVVHFPGLPVDMVSILAIARLHGIAVIEDCALALGGSLDGVPCGLWGDLASFSFYPAKHITTGEGGMVVSRDAAVVESVANIKAFGYDRGLNQRTVPGVYDISRLGLNFRMGEINAAIGLEQLKKAPTFAAVRERNMLNLRAAVGGLSNVRVLPDGDSRRNHANYCLVVQLGDNLSDQRDQVLLELKRKGVGASVYYPVALPLSRYYKDRYHAAREDFPVADQIARTSLALPVGPHISEEEVEQMSETFKQVVARLA